MNLVKAADVKSSQDNLFRVMFTMKPLGFVLTPLQNGVGAKVGQHSNKHLKQNIPRGTELFAIGDTKLVGLKHEEIMRLIDEAKLPLNLTFKKVNKRVRILTPRSANLLQSGKKSPEVKIPSSFASVDLGLKKLPSEEFKEKTKENAATKQKSEAPKPKQGKTRQQKRREYMQRQRARQAARLRQRQERNQQRFHGQNHQYQNRNHYQNLNQPQHQNQQYQNQNQQYQNRNQQRFDHRANHWQQRDPRYRRDPRYEPHLEERQYRNPRPQNYNRERFEQMRRMEFEYGRGYPQNDYQRDYPPQRGYSRGPQRRGDRSRAPQRRGYDRPPNSAMEYPARGYEPRSDYLFSDENIVGRLGRGEHLERKWDRQNQRQSSYHKEYRWKTADELYKNSPRRDPGRVMNLADFAPKHGKNNGSWSEVSSPLMLDSSDKSSADGHDSCSESGASSKQSVTDNEPRSELTMKELNATLLKVEQDKCSFLRSRGLDFNDDWVNF